jgi:fructan beta-fructosidase
VRWIDYGKDFYAAQSWSDVPAADGRRLWLGWMSNWQYANVTRTAPWRGAMSIPRAVTLKECAEGIQLVQRPVVELQRLRDRHYECTDVNMATANAILKEWGINGLALEIVAEFEPGTAAECGLRVRKGASEETCIGYEVNAGALFVDRTRSGDVGFDAHFAGRHAGPLRPEHGTVKMHVFVDQCSVEVFGNGGRTVITDLIFPSTQSTGAEVYATGGDMRLRVLDIWTLKP